MKLSINGRPAEVSDGATVATVVTDLVGADRSRGVAVAVNGDVVTHSTWSATVLAGGDSVEIVTAARANEMSDRLVIAGEALNSRLILGTGGAASHAEDPARMAAAMRHAVEAGRSAYHAGRIPRRLYATASSPIEGLPW